MSTACDAGGQKWLVHGDSSASLSTRAGARFAAATSGRDGFSKVPPSLLRVRCVAAVVSRDAIQLLPRDSAHSLGVAVLLKSFYLQEDRAVTE
jgi:hypothetical protein